MKNKNEPGQRQESKDAKGEQGAEVLLKESEYLALKAQADEAVECRERILRLQADCDNMRKRFDKEKQEFAKYANEGLILELLNVLDDLERTVELAESKHQDLSAFLKGVEMILAHLYQMLKQYGLKSIEAEGKSFDPNYHEALMQVEDDARKEHTIVEEMQKGYLLYDKVIRTAKVKVSRKSEQPDSEGPQDK